MSYFRELPNLQYPSFLSEKNSSLDYIEIKNIFRRIKLRDDLHNTFTMFDKYEIPMGYRPDMVAEELYGSNELDWVVLVTGGIINIRNDWPISDNDLYEFVLEKYGDDVNTTRFYETKEIKNSDDKVILPKGKVVNGDFVFTYYDNGRKSVSGADVRTGISNWEYEVRLNDEKKDIYLLKPAYLQDFLNDMRELMLYEKSSQYIDETTARTENSNISKS